MPARSSSAWNRARIRERLRRHKPVEEYVAGNNADFFDDSATYLLRLVEGVEAAKHSVLVEMYWLAPDTIGGRFLDACGDAAERGVRVVLLLDALGSFAADGAELRRGVARGLEVHWYNSFRAWQVRFGLTRLSRRNHRKLVLIDGVEAFVGGVNIADAWMPVATGGQGFRDEALRVRGPVIDGLVETFADTYRRVTNRSLGLGQNSAAAPCGDMAVAILRQGEASHRREALNAYLRQIRAAKRQVFIASAYFVPTPRLLVALRDTARRGVEVKILVPGISDIPFIRFASRATWGPLLSAGVRFFEWNTTVLHSKTAVIDGHWTTTGSFNLDYLSIRRNLELNLAVESAALAQRVEESFGRHLESCREITRDDFRRRSLLHRGLERFLFLFRRWL